MIEVEAATEIDAPASTVWSVLTDLPRFAAWNPFIRDARGGLEAGGEIRVRVRPSIGVPLRFRATVLESEPDHALHWRGHLIAPWLAFGDHVFAIEELPGGRVRFVQRERFGGILPRLAARLLAREVRRGFEAMNRALKERAEAQGRMS